MCSKEDIIAALKAMPSTEFMGVMKEAFVVGSAKKIMPKLKNVMSKVANKNKDGMPSSSVLEGTPMTSSGHTVVSTRPAWEVPLIFRGDLIPKNKHLFVDVEKVSESGSHKNIGATIAIVDDQRQLVMWAIIKSDNVCQVFPNLTGLNRAKIATGVSLLEVKKMLEMLLYGNTLVGVDVLNDLGSLDFGWKDKNMKIVDVHDFYKDEKGRIKLQDIVTHLFPQKVGFQCSRHTAISDARMTQKVWKVMKKYQDEGHESYPGKINRSQRAKLEVGDRCTCDVSKKKFKRSGNKKRQVQWTEFDMNFY